MVPGWRKTKTSGFPAGDGLLSRFIRDTLDRHVEPTRRGTPRGAPVGFSRQKLAAALFALTCTDMKRTAREVGVSYGLLRKWRTEAAFKALVERLEDDFVEAFCAAVDAASDARGPLWSPAWPDDADLNSLADVLDARCGQWIAVNAGDATRYGPRLIGKLTTRLLEDRAEGCLWPLAMLQTVVPRWASAGPDATLGSLDKRRVRAWVAMLRSIVLALEPGAPAGRETLARVYLRWLHRQLPAPSLDRIALTRTTRDGTRHPRRPQAARAARRGRGPMDSV